MRIENLDNLKKILARYNLIEVGFELECNEYEDQTLKLWICNNSSCEDMEKYIIDTYRKVLNLKNILSEVEIEFKVIFCKDYEIEWK